MAVKITCNATVLNEEVKRISVYVQGSNPVSHDKVRK